MTVSDIRMPAPDGPGRKASRAAAPAERAFEAPIEAVVIGVSAGGIKALSVILPALPAGYPVPILIVIHLPPARKSLIADLFRDKCRLDVREAEDKEPLAPGVVYFAPPDYHLLVEKDRSLSLSSEEPVMFSRPSIDVLFETAADAYGPALVGIILTGANPDGAHGLKAVKAAGGRAIVQTPAHAFAPAMPEAALQSCPEAAAMDLEEIAAYLQKAVDS
jgi:two-component system chemotaxis response regulator CheB